MSSSRSDVKTAQAKAVSVTEGFLIVELVDGRTLSVPLEWYPRLANATLEERNDWELLGEAEGIHWPRLDEDISVDGLLAGKASGESQASLKRWLLGRDRRG